MGAAVSWTDPGGTHAGDALNTMREAEERRISSPGAASLRRGGGKIGVWAAAVAASLTEPVVALFVQVSAYFSVCVPVDPDLSMVP